MPVDRGTIDTQLKQIGEGEHWWEQREFRELPHVLREDERMVGLAEGVLLGSRMPRVKPLPRRRWLMVATDQRLICLQQERYGRKQIDIPSALITGVDHTTKLRSYQITIETTSRRYRLRIPKDQAYRFTRALAPLLPARAPQPFAWIPGMTTVASLPGVGRLVSGFNSLATADDPRRGDVERLQATVERMQGTVERLEVDVERLQEQVAFLENLLRSRGEAADRQAAARNLPTEASREPLPPEALHAVSDAE